MNEKDLISKELKDFVIKESFVDDIELINTTDVQEDLDICGDDAIDFLVAFGKEFNVDLSNFYADKYFKPEGDPIFPAIVRLFTGKKATKYLSLTLGDMEEAIKKGKLE